MATTRPDLPDASMPRFSGPPPESDGVEVRVLPPAARSDACEAWTALESRIASTGLTCSWDWTETWLDVYGADLPHSFVLGERAGRPCGLALVVRGTGRSGAIPIRRLHVGTAGARAGEGINVEYNRLLVEPDSRAAFSAALLDTLVHAPEWDELVLDGFAFEEAEPLLAALPALKPSVRSSPYLDLCAGAERGGDVLAPLSSGPKRRLRRSMRGFGRLETEWAATPERALLILDELIALHQRRWRAVGEPGAFATERFRRFHRSLIARLLPLGAIMAFRVRAASGTIGCVYGFVERGRVLFYQGGFAAFDDNKLRPGLVTHALCMQAAADRGLVEYDFLPGESRYKDELSTGEHHVVWATARRRHLKSRVVDGQRRVKRAVGRLRAGT